MRPSDNPKRWTTTGWLLVAVTASYAATETPSSLAIPLHMVGGYAVVEAKIDGYDHPLRLIVDTAAGVSTLDIALAERLDLIDSDAHAPHVSGASGNAHSVRFAKKLKLEMAGTQFEIKPLVTPMSRFSHGDTSASARYDGILGNDLLRDYDVRFDVAAGVLALSQTGTEAPSHDSGQCQVNQFPLDRPPELAGFALVDVVANAEPGKARTIRAVVDTGAAQTLFNWAAIKQLGLEPGDARLRKRDRGTRGLSGHEIETHLTTLGSLGYGNWAIPDIEVRVTDLPVFKALGMAERAAVILGIDALQNTPLLISRGVSYICMG